MIFLSNGIICGGFMIYPDLYIFLNKASTFSVIFGIIDEQQVKMIKQKKYYRFGRKKLYRLKRNYDTGYIF